MKYLCAPIIFSSLLFPLRANAQLCEEGVYVNSIALGYVTGSQKHGPDHGDALVVYFDNGRGLPADKEYNLDHSRGSAILSTLQMAMALRLKVDIFDHVGTRCDDFQHVIINRAQ